MNRGGWAARGWCGGGADAGVEVEDRGWGSERRRVTHFFSFEVCACGSRQGSGGRAGWHPCGRSEGRDLAMTWPCEQLRNEQVRAYSICLIFRRQRQHFDSRKSICSVYHVICVWANSDRVIVHRGATADSSLDLPNSIKSTAEPNCYMGGFLDLAVHSWSIQSQS